MPCNCGKKVERLDLKIKCSDCKLYFHGKCVNLKASDIDYMEKSKTLFRCDHCSILRRKSLSQGPSAANKGIIPLNTNTSVQENMETHNVDGEITLQIVYAEILKLKTLNGDALSLIKNLEKDKQALERKVSDLERKVNIMQQDKRKKFVDIVGVPDPIILNPVQTVIKICSDALGVTVKDDDIAYCFVKKIKNKSNNNINQPAGNNNNNTGKSAVHSNIICAKFVSIACKQIIMDKRFSKNAKLNADIFGKEFASSKIYINDSLTSYNRALFKAAGNFKKSSNYKYLWIRNSSILLRKSDGTQVIRIDSFEDLNNIQVDTVC